MQAAADERLGQRRQREQRVRPDRLVPAALAYAGVAFRNQTAALVDDQLRRPPGTRPFATHSSTAASASSTPITVVDACRFRDV